ncbi:MAG TPA: CBS domain-containing protein [Flavobacterium sp.]|nr:CBS domain-containing protein [Flavobacterium sp.]
MFKEHKICHIPVVDDDKLAGVLSYSDLLLNYFLEEA